MQHLFYSKHACPYNEFKKNLILSSVENFFSDSLFIEKFIEQLNCIRQHLHC